MERDRRNLPLRYRCFIAVMRNREAVMRNMRDKHLRTLSPPGIRQVVRGSGSSGGFSLIELMVVVAIVLVMLKISMPIINSTMSAMHLGSAASSLAAGIQSARYQAISNGCPMSITASTGSYQLAAESIAGTPPTCTTTFVNVPGDMGLVQYATSDISLTSGTTTLYLNPNGTVTAIATGGVPTSFGLVLKPSNGTATKTVNVSGVGNVKVTAP
jgi:prepilin-type N-terminal cleavage/methylation domain-containing protein